MARGHHHGTEETAAVESMSLTVAALQAKVSALTSSLEKERSDSRLRHSGLIADLQAALSAREKNRQTIKRLEDLCVSAGLQSIEISEVIVTIDMHPP